MDLRQNVDLYLGLKDLMPSPNQDTMEYALSGRLKDRGRGGLVTRTSDGNGDHRMEQLCENLKSSPSSESNGSYAAWLRHLSQ